MSNTACRPENQRYHGMDYLRASMMLLGVILHSALSYMVTPISASFYKTANPSLVFDVLVGLIHLFRMPVFFVVAGFFAALLLSRYRLKGMIKNRCRRILLPFLLFWPGLFVLAVINAIAVSTFMATGEYGLNMSYLPPSPENQTKLPLLHLWFMYYLMYFYLIAAVIVAVSAKGGQRVWHMAGKLFEQSLRQFWGVILLVAIVVAMIAPYPSAVLPTNDSFIPNSEMLLYYGLFFGVGWTLYYHQGIFEIMQSHCRISFFTALFLYAAALLIMQPSMGNPTLHLINCVLQALSLWCFIFSLIGMSLRYFSKPHAVTEYLSQASYWVYLVHMPITIVVPLLLAKLGLSIALKYFITVLLTTGLCLLSYHWLVRGGLIGSLLSSSKAYCPKR